MKQQRTLYLVLKSIPHPLPSAFKHFSNISHDISDSLIFNFNHSYNVESNVSEEALKSFIDYLVDDTIPEINIDNINEFIELSKEFIILQNEIEQKKDEFGEYLININQLRFHNEGDVSEYEENIAQQLDEYIEHYSKSLMQIPIQNLYNIFNHRKRRMIKHDEAYEMIKTEFENTHNFNIFILLESLDGHQLSKTNLLESISLSETRFNHKPTINFSYIINMIDKQNEHETQILNLEHKFEQFQEETKNQNRNNEEKTTLINNQHQRYQEETEKIITNQNKKIEELTTLIDNQYQRYQEETETKITNQNKKIEEITKIIEEKDIVLKELNQKIDLLTNKMNEKTSKIEKQQQNYEEETKLKLNKCEEEIEKITKLNDEKDQKYENNFKENEKKCSVEIEKLQNAIDSLKNKNNDKFNTIEKKLDKTQGQMKTEMLTLIGHSASNSFTTQLDLSNPGIFEELKKREKSKFDSLFIASQSSDDIYNLINPDFNGYFGTSNENNFYIEFELKEKISINGIRIFTSDDSFPKSFNIEIDGKIVSSIKEANELNGPNKVMSINFEPVKTQKVHFIQTGYNWDKNNYYLNIKRIELLSDEEKYSKGVFETLVNENKDHDPHKIGVFISALHFDFNHFYTQNKTFNICTNNFEDSWFQIELTQGLAMIHGFRLTRKTNNKLKNYKIICTDDMNNPIESWTTIFEIDEKNENEHQLLDIYELKQPSPPARFIRLIQTGKNWNGRLFLTFFHFDIFGTYF